MCIYIGKPCQGCVCWKRLETIQFEPIKLEGKQEAGRREARCRRRLRRESGVRPPSESLLCVQFLTFNIRTEPSSKFPELSSANRWRDDTRANLEPFLVLYVTSRSVPAFFHILPYSAMSYYTLL